MKNNKQCIFCKIVRDELPSKTVFEDKDIKAFWDINPQADVHIIIIPKKHINTINTMKKEDINLVGNMVYTAKKIAKDFKLKGYKLIFSVEKEGGQEIFHIHLHLIGNKK